MLLRLTHSSFAHDRYMQASAALRECFNTTEMHYVIAQTMMKYVGVTNPLHVTCAVADGSLARSRRSRFIYSKRARMQVDRHY